MDQLPIWLMIAVVLILAVGLTGLVSFVSAVVINFGRPMMPSARTNESSNDTSNEPSASAVTPPTAPDPPDIVFVETRPLLPSHPDNPNGGANPLSARSSVQRRG